MADEYCWLVIRFDRRTSRSAYQCGVSLCNVIRKSINIHKYHTGQEFCVGNMRVIQQQNPNKANIWCEVAFDGINPRAYQTSTEAATGTITIIAEQTCDLCRAEQWPCQMCIVNYLAWFSIFNWNRRYCTCATVHFVHKTLNKLESLKWMREFCWFVPAEEGKEEEE